MDTNLSASAAFDSPDDPMITRSNIWFEDGNIVLQAQTTQFCVHRGILAQNSVVFRNMLSIPQGDQPNAMAQTPSGEPLVQLPDTAQEMAYLLEGLYSPLKLAKMKLEKKTHERLCAVLRLSTKYMILHLREAVSDVFTRYYPSTLDTCGAFGSVFGDRQMTVWDWEDDVINALYEAQLLSPLPFLLYRYAQGVTELEIHTSSLSSNSVARIFTGLEVIRTSVRVFLVHSFEFKRWYSFWDTVIVCEYHASCAKAAMRIWDKLLMGEVALRGGFDPMYFDPKNLDGFCLKCTERIRGRIEERRKTLWDRLPGIFGFETWEKIKEADATYLANMSSQE